MPAKKTAHLFRRGPNPRQKAASPVTSKNLSNRLNNATKKLQNEVNKGSKASEWRVNKLLKELLRVAGAYSERLRLEFNKSPNTPNSSPNLSPTTLAKINRELQNLQNEVNLDELQNEINRGR